MDQTETKSLLDRLRDPAAWEEFLAYKIEGGHLSKREEADLARFVSDREYEAVADRILSGESLSPPRKSAIAKKGTDKKRIVYIFPREEKWALKLITYCLREYDGIFSQNLYSFRVGQGAKKAVARMLHGRRIEESWTYRTDIHDYFNSVDIGLLLPMLQEVFAQDPQMYRFFEQMLTADAVVDRGTVHTEKRGIMAGTPTAVFLANLYLSDMDHFFQEQHIPYARYADDIFLMAGSEEELTQRIGLVREWLAKKHLEINPKKDEIRRPGDPKNFLGVTYHKGRIAVSEVAVEKLKNKMRRKVRALQRWQRRKNLDNAKAVKGFINRFNTYFFRNDEEHELTWCRWYFPMISSDEQLKCIDHYMQSCIRYLYCGRHTKAAFNLRYETMREMGYRSLVHAYYEWKKEEGEKCLK